MISGLVVSDGHPEDGQETYYWTRMAHDMMSMLCEEVIMRFQNSMRGTDV